jgi:hypothetical protein
MACTRAAGERRRRQGATAARASASLERMCISSSSHRLALRLHCQTPRRPSRRKPRSGTSTVRQSGDPHVKLDAGCIRDCRRSRPDPTRQRPNGGPASIALGSGVGRWFPQPRAAPVTSLSWTPAIITYNNATFAPEPVSSVGVFVLVLAVTGDITAACPARASGLMLAISCLIAPKAVHCLARR